MMLTEAVWVAVWAMLFFGQALSPLLVVATLAILGAAALELRASGHLPVEPPAVA
jgi:hypothetical protein